MNAAESTLRSAAIAVIAFSAPSTGGPDNSTAPPGSTVTALPPGSGGNPEITAPSSAQVGRRIGSARSKLCASTSRPTRPVTPSCRQRRPSSVAASAAPASSRAWAAGGAPAAAGGGASVVTVKAIGGSLSGPACRRVDRWSARDRIDRRYPILKEGTDKVPRIRVTRR